MEQEAKLAPAKERPPFLLLPIFLLGFFGVVAVWVGDLTTLHPLLKPSGLAAFAGANFILILQATFRKKYSNIVGEFHAMNAVSWIISIALFIATAVLGGILLYGWAYLNGETVSENRLIAIAKFLALIFATPIAYGWIKWFFKKRK